MPSKPCKFCQKKSGNAKLLERHQLKCKMNPVNIQGEMENTKESMKNELRESIRAIKLDLPSLIEQEIKEARQKIEVEFANWSQDRECLKNAIKHQKENESMKIELEKMRFIMQHFLAYYNREFGQDPLFSKPLVTSRRLRLSAILDQITSQAGNNATIFSSKKIDWNNEFQRWIEVMPELRDAYCIQELGWILIEEKGYDRRDVKRMLRTTSETIRFMQCGNQQYMLPPQQDKEDISSFESLDVVYSSDTENDLCTDTGDVPINSLDGEVIIDSSVELKKTQKEDFRRKLEREEEDYKSTTVLDTLGTILENEGGFNQLELKDMMQEKIFSKLKPKPDDKKLKNLIFKRAKKVIKDLKIEELEQMYTDYSGYTADSLDN